jgi:hypothetical protein
MSIRSLGYLAGHGPAIANDALLASPSPEAEFDISKYEEPPLNPCLMFDDEYTRHREQCRLFLFGKRRL